MTILAEPFTQQIIKKLSAYLPNMKICELGTAFNTKKDPYKLELGIIKFLMSFDSELKIVMILF